MPCLDYAKIPSVEPDFENSRLITYNSKRGNDYTETKIVDNQYIDSPNRSYPGFSKVGKSPKTGYWRIIWVRGYW